MDVGQLLAQARGKAGISQAELARRSAMARSQLSRYETGVVSPSVATLERLLAACGLQLAGALEPYVADVDAHLDELLAAGSQLNLANLPNLVLTLDDDPAAVHHPLFRGHREGPVTWAFDGATALSLHGLPVGAKWTCVVVVLDDAARWWLHALQAPLEHNGHRVNVTEAPRDVLVASLGQPFSSHVDDLLVRVVDELPPTVRLGVEWTPAPVPVVTVDAVERGHPHYARLLENLRSRVR